MNEEKENKKGLNVSSDLFDESDEDFIFLQNQENQAMMDQIKTTQISPSSLLNSKENPGSNGVKLKNLESNQIKTQSETKCTNIDKQPSPFVASEHCDIESVDCSSRHAKRRKEADYTQGSDHNLSELCVGKPFSAEDLRKDSLTENDRMLELPSHSYKENLITGSSVDEESDTCNPLAKSERQEMELSCPFCCVKETCVLLLEHHIFTAHPDISDSENCREQENSVSAFLFVCPLCDMDLETEPALATHLHSAHPEEENLSDLGPDGGHSCPLCASRFVSAEEMATHVKSHETDTTYYGISGSSQEPEVPHYTLSQDFVCPLCGKVMGDADLLTSHVETHFSPQHCPVDGDRQSVNKENIPVKEINHAHPGPSKSKADIPGPSTLYSGASSKALSQTSNSSLTAKDVSSYRRQYERSLEKEVLNGRISVADYHEQRAGMQGRDLRGVDDGHSRVDGLIELLARLYRQQARPGQLAYLCAPTSHFSGSHGDKGWGCGYRNFQMMLSCLANQSQYAEKIFRDGRYSIPSVPKVQQMIELAWNKGFDPDGCRQLQGQVVNTQKWIGATEIVATLSSLGIRCRLADFHAPSAADGSHPRLLEWVTDYFTGRQNQQFTPPLYLQHQGHSRTIVGVEIDRGTTRLLLFDPGSKKDHIAALATSGLNWKSMRTFRRTQLAFKAKQYQIVAVDGILTQREYEESKIIKSERIS